MQFLWKWVDEMVGKGFEYSTILELLFYASATFVPMALPLAVLLSSLMTFGNLGEKYELIALKSAGISLPQIMKPLIILMFFVIVGAFYFSNNVMPKANLKFFTLLRDIRQQKPAVQINDGVFYSDIDDFVIKIGKKEEDGTSISDVIIYNHSVGQGNTNVTYAKSGKMEITEDKQYLIFTLFDGYNYSENVSNARLSDNPNKPFQKTTFSKEIRRIDLSAFKFNKSGDGLYRGNYKMLNISQLNYYIDSLLQNKQTAYIDYQDYVLDDFGFRKLYSNIQNDSLDMLTDSSNVLNDSIDSNAENENNLEKQDSTNIDSTALDSTKQIKSFSERVFGVKRKRTNNKDNTTNQNEDTNQTIAEDPKTGREFYNFPLDTSIVLADTFLLNFHQSDQEKIIESAISSIRSSSYHTIIINDNMKSKEKLIVKHKIEYYRKFTLSIACLILFFIGAPLGAIIRKGGLGVPIIASIFIFVLYHVFTIIGEKSAESMVITPLIGMWMANIIFFPLGIFLTYKAATDSPLMDAESWNKYVSKITKRFRKK